MPYGDDPFVWHDPAEDIRQAAPAERPASERAAPNAELSAPLIAPSTESSSGDDIWVELPAVGEGERKPRRNRGGRGRGRREGGPSEVMETAEAPQVEALAEAVAESAPVVAVVDEPTAKPARKSRSKKVVEAQPEAEFTTFLLDPSREHVWTTSLNPRRRLVLGYLMRRADYPWMLNGGQYTTPGKPVRGMEFGMTLSGRKRSVEQGRLFDTPTYRWLPANGSVTTRFLMFYARTPDGFSRVDDVRLENGQLVIEDRRAGRTVRLKASMNL